MIVLGRSVEFDEASLDRPHVGVLLMMLDADRFQLQPSSGRIGQEQVWPVPDAGGDGVLQEAMGDVHGRAEQFGLGADRLADGLAPVDEHFQFEPVHE